MCQRSDFWKISGILNFFKRRKKKKHPDVHKGVTVMLQLTLLLQNGLERRLIQFCPVIPDVLVYSTEGVGCDHFL